MQRVLWFDYHWLQHTVKPGLILYDLAQLAVMIVIAEIVFLLSGQCTKNRDAILMSCGVLMIPAGLAAIGSGAGEWLSFLILEAEANFYTC